MKLFSIFKTTIFLSTTLLFTACGPANSTPTPTPELIPAELITQWSGEGQYCFYGISIDKNDNVYTTGGGNSKIRKFDSNGTLLLQWGSEGSGDGQFVSPVYDIAMDSHNNVYVADWLNYRIQKFDSNGTFLLKWGSRGSGEGQFLKYIGIATDGQDNIYVADSNNHRIQKFDSNGSFLAKWGEEGNGDGQFSFPKDITIDTFGYMYIVDNGNYRIQKFDSNGAFLLQWGSQLMWGKKDSDNMKFEDIWNVHTDGRGNLYVVDSGRAIIKKFDTNGNFISSWNGSTDGKRLIVPVNVDTDSSGNVYVADDYYIWKFKP